ncbi:MAG: 3-methyl-2-oxobutanoate hydroxymethyltransferase [Candidatus Polarisedimenticolia bacterium]
MQDKVTVPVVRSRKASVPGSPAERLVVLTAYDHPTAVALDRAGVDILLVGDSLGMVVLGHRSTLPVTLEMMLHHTAAVARAATRALVVADMPWLTYHTVPADAVRNAGRLVQEAGAEAVKLEGGRARLEVVRALVNAEIPVMGHLGLTPQSVHVMGGYRVQGKRLSQAEAIVEDARALEEAGVFSIVLEGMPAAVGRMVTEAVGVPTIGIGAGPGCDGQVLVVHDLIGLGEITPPRFVRRYADVGRIITEAASSFVRDVRSGDFPSERESYPTPPGMEERLAPPRMK